MSEESSSKHPVGQLVVQFQDKFNRELRFDASSQEAFEKWSRTARRKLRRLLTLDVFPKIKVEQRVTAEIDLGDVVRRKLVFETLPGLTVPAYLFLPKSGGKRPGVLCPHGHGRGISHIIEADDIYHAYPEALARAGCVTLCPELVNFGERADVTCELLHERLGMVGVDVMGLRTWECRLLTDWLLAMPEVDRKRIGVAGLSLGGEMTLYLGAVDTRFKASVASGFITSFRSTFLTEPHCTCGFIRDVARYFEHADIAALFAPRALMIQTGTKDSSFRTEVSRKAYRELRKVYKLYGNTRDLALDVFDGGHEFRTEKAVPWLAKKLSRS